MTWVYLHTHRCCSADKGTNTYTLDTAVAWKLAGHFLEDDRPGLADCCRSLAKLLAASQHHTLVQDLDDW